MKRKKRTAIALVLALAMTGILCGAPAEAAAKPITAKKAVKIALKNARTKKSRVRRLKTEYDKEEQVYEVEFIKKKNRTEYSYDIAREGGRIMERDVDYPYKKTCCRKKIGKKKARKIVARRSKKKLSIIKAGTCKYRYRKHLGTYEVKFRYGSAMYEYELLAATGKIKEIEYKYVGSK